MVAKAAAAASLLLGAMAHTGLAASSAPGKASLEIPASGGTRPIAGFGVQTGQHAANQQVAFTADADIGPSGLFVKGYVLNAAEYKNFDAACTKGQAVNVYEWGYGPCDDYMTALKAITGQTTFTATASATETGGAKIAASVPLTVANAGAGLYVIFENLLGAPVTFKNAQFTVAGQAGGAAGKDLVFPAATVHMSAAMVKVGNGHAVDDALVRFNAKNSNPAGAKSTAVMVLNEEQLEADKLGCTMGFYFGWFKKNTAGLNVCKGVDFQLHKDGDILTIHGTIKYVPSDKQAELLGGDIQVDPSYAMFQGDGAYSFAAVPNGAKGVAVVIPNRLDTPITLEDLHVEYTSSFAGLVGGRLAGLCIGLIALVGFLMLGSFFFGKRRGAAGAAPAAGQKGAGIV